MKPTVKPPGTKRLILYCDKAVSNFGFKFNLRRYTKTRSKVALCPGNTLGLGKDGIGQGLTLILFSAQSESFLTQNTP
jgi:hypothetical protein